MDGFGRVIDYLRISGDRTDAMSDACIACRKATRAGRERRIISRPTKLCAWPKLLVLLIS